MVGFVLCVVRLTLTPITTPAVDVTSFTDDSEFQHAEWLENQGELYRCASSYLRVLHATQEPGLRDKAAIGVVRALRRGEQWKDSVLWGQKVRAMDLTPTAAALVALEVSHSLARLDRPEEALREADGADPQLLDAPGRCRRARLLGFSYLLLHDVPAARSQWSKGGACLEEGDLLRHLLDEADGIRRESKWKAGCLAIVPGAGYLVTDKRQTALATLVVNGLLIGGAVEAFNHDLDFIGATFSVFAVGWYTGSIYGSVTSVDRRYDARWRDVLTGVDMSD